ncbi:hypothetical protein B0H11DRAFT_2330749 [Mycena galericulata]|nr:hypothetical protein B0H11DRAFT_2330749 [Mycena galericulata]
MSKVERLMVLFHDLDEDVVPRILEFCDIYTVLSVSRVSKVFRALTLSPQLWISILLDLSARCLIYIPDRQKLLTSSTKELIGEVRRLISGPTTWSEQSPTPPTISSSRSFHNVSLNAGVSGIRLLPGGGYFVLDQGLSIRCFDASTGECIWSRPTRVSDYAVEMLDDGRSAIFFLVLYTSIQELAVVHVHFTTGHSEDLFHVRLNIHMGFCKNPAVSQDLLGLCLRFTDTDDSALIVINWRQRTFVIFNGSPAWPRPGVAFVPGHVILTTAAKEAPYEQLILVYTLTSIASRWEPLSEVESNDRLSRYPRILAEDTSPAIVEHIAHQNQVFRNASRVQMTLHKSPLHENGYKLILYVSDLPAVQEKRTLRQQFGLAPRRAQGAMLFTFRLMVPSSTERVLRLSRTSVTPAVADLFFPKVSYAGYSVDSVNGRVIDVRIAESRRHNKQDLLSPAAAREIGVDHHTGYGSVHLLASTVTIARFPEVKIQCYV